MKCRKSDVNYDWMEIGFQVALLRLSYPLIYSCGHIFPYFLHSSTFYPLMFVDLSMYNSLIQSHLEYGVLAWGSSTNKLITSINKMQKRCIRNLVSGNWAPNPYEKVATLSQLFLLL